MPTLIKCTQKKGGSSLFPVGLFVLIDSGFEGSKCEGGFGLDAFPDDGDGIARETSIEDPQEPVADQGQTGQEGSVSAP